MGSKFLFLVGPVKPLPQLTFPLKTRDKNKEPRLQAAKSLKQNRTAITNKKGGLHKLASLHTCYLENSTWKTPGFLFAWLPPAQLSSLCLKNTFSKAFTGPIDKVKFLCSSVFYIPLIIFMYLSLLNAFLLNYKTPKGEDGVTLFIILFLVQYVTGVSMPRY